MPFHVGSTRNQRHVVQVDYLVLPISPGACFAEVDKATFSCRSNLGCRMFQHTNFRAPDLFPNILFGSWVLSGESSVYAAFCGTLC